MFVVTVSRLGYDQPRVFVLNNLVDVGEVLTALMGRFLNNPAYAYITDIHIAKVDEVL